MSGRWQANHVFVLIGPAAFDHAKSLYDKGQCQPAIPCPEQYSPELYKWPVYDRDVTVVNLGASDDLAEDMVYELLKAGAKIVAHVDHSSGAVSIHRSEELPNAA
jgi:hypothetical protein